MRQRWVFWRRKGTADAWTGSTQPPPSLDASSYDLVVTRGELPGPVASPEAIAIAAAIAQALGRPSSEYEMLRVDRALRRLRGIQC